MGGLRVLGINGTTGEAILGNRNGVEIPRMVQRKAAGGVPKRVYIPREDLEVFGFTARCSRCMFLQRTLNTAQGGFKRS